MKGIGISPPPLCFTDYISEHKQSIFQKGGGWAVPQPPSLQCTLAQPCPRAGHSSCRAGRASMLSAYATAPLATSSLKMTPLRFACCLPCVELLIVVWGKGCLDFLLSFPSSLCIIRSLLMSRCVYICIRPKNVMCPSVCSTAMEATHRCRCPPLVLHLLTSNRKILWLTEWSVSFVDIQQSNVWSDTDAHNVSFYIFNQIGKIRNWSVCFLPFALLRC